MGWREFEEGISSPTMTMSYSHVLLVVQLLALILNSSDAYFFSPRLRVSALATAVRGCQVAGACHLPARALNQQCLQRQQSLQRQSIFLMHGAKIEEFYEEEEVAKPGPPKTSPDADTRTDEEKGLTHGYEGDYKVGDVVRVVTAGRIWSVKPYTKEGFSPIGLVGKVQSLVLYGRKYKTLCSAITPIKVEFQPTDPSITSLGLSFERKFTLHFSAEEVQRVE